MDRVIHGQGELSAAYLDDLIIFSETFQEVLLRLREAGLTAKAKKCFFGVDKCLYLGHVVGVGVVYPKLQAVKELPTLKTKKDVRLLSPFPDSILTSSPQSSAYMAELSCGLSCHLRNMFYMKNPLSLAAIMHVNLVIHLTDFIEPITCWMRSAVTLALAPERSRAFLSYHVFFEQLLKFPSLCPSLSPVSL